MTYSQSTENNYSEFKALGKAMEDHFTIYPNKAWLFTDNIESDYVDYMIAYILYKTEVTYTFKSIFATAMRRRISV